MKKVKVFTDVYVRNIEKDINKFLVDNNAEILYIRTMISDKTRKYIYTIIYEEIKN